MESVCTKSKMCWLQQSGTTFQKVVTFTVKANNVHFQFAVNFSQFHYSSEYKWQVFADTLASSMKTTGEYRKVFGATPSLQTRFTSDSQLQLAGKYKGCRSSSRSV